MKLGRLEELPIFAKYLPSNLSRYAVCRVRYLTAKAFKNYQITKQEKTTKTFLIERKPGCEDLEDITTDP